MVWRSRMAGDWTPYRNNLRKNTTLKDIARALSIPINYAAGCCMAVWAWAGDFTADGTMKGTLEDIDDEAGIPGFGVAMQTAGWVKCEDGTLEFPEWESWNGKCAKARLTGAVKKRVQREKKVVSPICPRSVPLLSPIEGDTLGTTEEKSTEEKSTKPKPPPTPTPVGPAAEAGRSDVRAPIHGAARFANARKPETNTVNEILGAYPVRGGGQAARDAVYNAVARICRGVDLEWPEEIPRPGTPPDAAAWLLDRVRAYCASGDVKRKGGQFALGIVRWMEEARYLDPDEAWNRVIVDDKPDRREQRRAGEHETQVVMPREL